MDTPKITQQELLQCATNFADEMIKELKTLNISVPEDMRTSFQEFFISYLAQRYVIVPDPEKK